LLAAEALSNVHLTSEEKYDLLYSIDQKDSLIGQGRQEEAQNKNGFMGVAPHKSI
jgi:hypothetical protein